MYMDVYGGFHKWGYPKMDGVFKGFARQPARGPLEGKGS